MEFKGTKEEWKVREAAPQLLKALECIIDPLTGMVCNHVANYIGTSKSYQIERAINKALN